MNEEMMTMEEVEVEETQKESFGEKAAGFWRRHKGKIITGAVAVGAGLLGLAWGVRKSRGNSGADFESFDGDDFVDVEIEDVE